MTKEEFRTEFPTTKYGRYIEEKLNGLLVELRLQLEHVPETGFKQLQGEILAIRKTLDALNLKVKPELTPVDAGSSEEHSQPTA